MMLEKSSVLFFLNDVSPAGVNSTRTFCSFLVFYTYFVIVDESIIIEHDTKKLAAGNLLHWQGLKLGSRLIETLLFLIALHRKRIG